MINFIFGIIIGSLITMILSRSMMLREKIKLKKETLSEYEKISGMISEYEDIIQTMISEYEDIIQTMISEVKTDV